jgi:hypothetical protein
MDPTNSRPEKNDSSGLMLKLFLKARPSQTAAPTAQQEELSSDDITSFSQNDSTINVAESRGPSVSARPSFLDSIDQEAIDLYNLISSDPEIQTVLPNLTRPNSDPNLAELEDFDLDEPWTAKKLFHLYILAYSRNAYNICDLVADTWIREFQKINGNPKIKIWQPNCSKHVVDQAKTAPRNDNGDPYLDYQVSAFDLQRLWELYANTNDGCGGRAVWADAMALCGNWLRVRLGKPGLEKELWHPDLMWDVFHTSLGHLRKTRLTAKIEEKHPKEWCKRYHEHGKHGAGCYREVEREQAQANDANAVRAPSAGNKGDRMELDAAQGAKQVSFAGAYNPATRG